MKLWLLFLAMCYCCGAIAQSAFTYQGRLLDGGGPLTNLALPVSFLLFDAETGGNQIGSTVDTTANVSDGYFTIVLDFGNEAFTVGPRWIEIVVNGVTLAPRQPVTAAPLATTLTVPAVLKGDSTAKPLLSVRNSHTGGFDAATAIYARTEGGQYAYALQASADYGVAIGGFTNHGIGIFSSASDGIGVYAYSSSATALRAETSTGYALFAVAYGSNPTSSFFSGSTSAIRATNGQGSGMDTSGYGPITVQADSNLGPAVVASTSSANKPAIVGLGKYVGVEGGSIGSPAAGVHGMSSTGYGLWSEVQTGSGLYSIASGNNGYGVWGRADKGTAIFGQSLTNIPIWGLQGGNTGINWGSQYYLPAIIGESNVNGGIVGVTSAVNRIAIGAWAPTIGVQGYVTDQSAWGVIGHAASATGVNYGVLGYSDSIEGTGVAGVSSTDTGLTYGLYGENHSATGRAVYGLAVANTGTNYGVRGATNSSSGYGVFSVGNFAASGTKAFVIDHPMDPENKYLKHYCTEGPAPTNQYRGNVVLNTKGEAWVELPNYFEEINKDFSYQLTCIGGYAQVFVAQEIKGNRFKIAGGKSGLKVSWLVQATRNDRWVRENGAPVEIDKPDSERGKYLHPELYGQPKQRAVDHTGVAGRGIFRIPIGNAKDFKEILTIEAVHDRMHIGCNFCQEAY